MKNIFLLMIIAITLIFSNCKKDENSVSNNNNPPPVETGIRIKGNIPLSKTSGDSLSISDAKKVLVFSKYYYSLTDIVDGSFSVTGQIGTGVALVFLTADNKYIGNLSSRGLNMLPLGNLVDGENTTIDLSTLTLVGNSVIPSNDPFGNEIIISDTEINSLKVIDSYYESIAQNIDTDNDSIPDVLSNRQLVVYTIFGINAGHWGFNDSLATLTDSAHYYVNYMIEIGGGSGLTFSNGNITLSGPVEDPYSDIIKWGYLMAPACGADRGFIASFGRETVAQPGAPWGSAFLPFKKGTYTVTLDGNQSFTLNYSNIDVKYSLIIIIPTLHTNSDGKLTSIALEYKLPDGTVVNPASMLTNVMVQFSDKFANQFYNSNPKLTSKTGFTGLSIDPPMDISLLYNIGVWYDDLLGNQYVIIWL
ncbi:MAG: hypothetical protein C0417_03060 [Chlorobiaceae bacterium]|nr:hypothetical protein [Chlorobiaceae bacterium]